MMEPIMALGLAEMLLSYFVANGKIDKRMGDLGSAAVRMVADLFSGLTSEEIEVTLEQVQKDIDTNISKITARLEAQKSYIEELRKTLKK